MAQKTDSEINEELNRKGHMAFHWDDLDKVVLPTGIVTSMYRVGDPTDDSSPTVFNVFYPPDCFVEAHTHECDYTEIILEGTQRVGATWHKAGDVRIGLANRGYGPLVAGPEGTKILFVFKDGRWPAKTLGNNDGSTLGSEVISDHFEHKNAEQA
ncbi:MAG: hypothetical protein ACI8Z1_001510 [Candidatus Azotimanducaceae bacterium]